MISDQDLLQLKHRINLLEGQVSFLYKHLGIEFVPEVSTNDDPRIIELLKKGNKMDAIKIYREITNADLLNAKNAIEEIQKRLGV
jgi:ribosomal protein L7/L12